MTNNTTDFSSNNRDESYSKNKRKNSILFSNFSIVVFIFGLFFLLFIFLPQYRCVKMARNTTAPTPAVWLNYLNKYPKGFYVKEAEKALLKVAEDYPVDILVLEWIQKHEDKEIARQLADLAYENTKDRNSVAAWRFYMNNMPKSFLKDAEDRLGEALVEEAAAVARSKSTRSASESYIERYPRGQYVENAREEMENDGDFEDDEDFEGIKDTKKEVVKDEKNKEDKDFLFKLFGID